MTIVTARPGLANPGHERPKLGYGLIPLFVLACVSAWLTGCSPAAPANGSAPGLKDKAAAEATAIIQSAEATAMVLQAQAKATALVQSASISGPTPAPAVTPLPLLEPTPQPVVGVASPTLSSATELTDTEEADSTAIQIVRVEVGTETGLILVQFKAPPAMARKWQQGMVYVVDEATGTLYNEIPVLPVVGPLFGRPKEAGQIGHVELVNMNSSLRRGALVTVVLGSFKQEHVTVQ
jgi:hypothetical protein